MRVAVRALTLLLVLVPAMAPGTGAAVHHPQKITFFFGLKRPEKAAQHAFFAVRQPGSLKPGYDLASGLGVPEFARLAASLPSPAG